MAEAAWSELRKRADDATRPPPPGTYVLEVTKAEAARAQSSGNPMIKMTMRVVDGPSRGKTVFNNMNLNTDNDFAMLIFFRHMNAFGLDESYFATLPPGEPGLIMAATALVGRRVQADLSLRTWNNVERAQVDNMTPVGGAVNPATVGLPTAPRPTSASTVGSSRTPGVPPIPTLTTPQASAAPQSTVATPQPTTPEVSEVSEVPHTVGERRSNVPELPDDPF